MNLYDTMWGHSTRAEAEFYLKANCKEFLKLDPKNSLITKNSEILAMIRYIRAPFNTDVKGFEGLSQSLANQVTWFSPNWSSIVRNENSLKMNFCSDKLRKVFDQVRGKPRPSGRGQEREQ